MKTRHEVVSVKGALPETFVIMGTDVSEGSVRSMSEGMSEKELRACLGKLGESEETIVAAIDRARKNPK